MANKKLASIMDGFPPARAATPRKTTDSKKLTRESESVSLPPSTSTEANERITATKVTQHIKQQMRQRIVDSQGTETERTIVLRGLKAIGFDIPDEELIDRRGGDRRSSRDAR
ncbi:MAG: hypothetical protein RLY93_12220 [Sumerlaeia bacterium]